ncbi:MAG: hypothetical protein N4A45_00610 [Flavobacteriales bacterium]|jgi:hypothetical protein|nr:hypothetical protein [Flavobacteriales bacterium]
MTFNQDSGLVKYVWVPLVKSGIFKLENVPALGNLKEVVADVINSNK